MDNIINININIKYNMILDVYYTNTFHMNTCDFHKKEVVFVGHTTQFFTPFPTCDLLFFCFRCLTGKKVPEKPRWVRPSDSGLVAHGTCVGRDLGSWGSDSKRLVITGILKRGCRFVPYTFSDTSRHRWFFWGDQNIGDSPGFGGLIQGQVYSPS